MSEVYDVLKEPWVPVIDLNGNAVKVSVEEALTNAKSYREISESNCLIEFSIYRFLNVFLMDMIRPDSIEDIEDLLSSPDSFSKSEFIRYRNMCEEEGSSFDLFDENRPFLQATINGEYDRETKPATYLNCTIPSGHNAVHFDHLDSNEGIPFEKVLPEIISCQLFATASVQDYPSTINGCPPYYAVIKGSNLYETLCNMLIPMDEIRGSFDKPKVFWRERMEVVPKEKVSRTSFLYGMLFPVRRIRVIPDFYSKTVKEVYYMQGMNYPDKQNWDDPDTAYYYSDKGRLTIKPDPSKPIWRNINDLIDSNHKTAPAILSLYKRINYSNYAHISLYGVLTNQASYLQIMKSDLKIPTSIINDKKCMNTLKNMVITAQYVAVKIEEVFKGKKTTKKEKSEKEDLEKVKLEKLTAVFASVCKDCINLFYQQCETTFWQFINDKLQNDNIDSDEITDEWRSSVARIARNCISKVIDSLVLPASTMMLFYKSQRTLDVYLASIENKEAFNG